MTGCAAIFAKRRILYNIMKCSLGNIGGRLSDGFWRCGGMGREFF